MMSSGEAAQQAKQAAMQANYDAKKFPCGPWLDGARGGPWIHVFKPAFENAMRERTDQFSSLYEHFISETAYGARRGPAHPQGNGLASLNISSIASYRTRDEKAYAYILLVIGYDKDIEDKIREHVRDVLTGAPSYADVLAEQTRNAAIDAANAANVIDAAAGGNHQVQVPQPLPAVGAANQLPNDWIAQLYRWIDSDLGKARESGLLISTQNTTFESIKMTDVGINRDTPTKFHQHLERVNNQRAVPKSPMDVWIKFLSRVPDVHRRAQAIHAQRARRRMVC